MKNLILLGIIELLTLDAAILPPPWADPDKNPCASQPGGWLLVYWPSDGKCYRIFHRGYPCPETMELNPVQNNFNKTIAECRCPPRTAQNSTSNICYPINTQGPCQKGEFFAPFRLSVDNKRRLGHCVKAKQCKPNEAFWPGTEKCYPTFTKGPCPDGQLLVFNKETQLGECQCSFSGTLSKYYWSPTKTCHEYYSKGPCQEKGTLFLPGPTCGCNQILPNYDPITKQCYEIGGMGPCKPGHRFDLAPPKSKASCICKSEHVLWQDGQCYRLYTRGPCPPGELIFNNKTCRPNPCRKGKLYFPEDGSCHRVGVKGPCARGQLVLFEQSIRPSVEGISYRGVCGCTGPEKCKTEDLEDLNSLPIAGRSVPNLVEEDKSISKQEENAKETIRKISICGKNEKPESDNCYGLYTRGPCSQGEWLIPVRQGRTEGRVHRFGWTYSRPSLMYDESRKLGARCECKQGYSRSSDGADCHLLLVTLAKFLNGDDFFS